jgi:hypothetical protein
MLLIPPPPPPPLESDKEEKSSINNNSDNKNIFFNLERQQKNKEMIANAFEQIRCIGKTNESTTLVCFFLIKNIFLIF